MQSVEDITQHALSSLFRKVRRKSKKQVSITIATGLFPPDIGGPATYSKFLSDELPKQGIGVVVVTFSAYSHLPRGIRHAVYFFVLLYRSFKTQLIFAQDPISVGLPAVLVAKLTRKPLFIRIVGDYAWEQGVQRFGVKESLDAFVKKEKGFHIFVRMLRKLQTWSAHQASCIVTPSAYMKGIIKAWGVGAKHITAIPNPVRPVSILGNRRTLRAMLKVRGKVIISSGRLVPWKGFDTLIEILPRIQKDFPGTKLVIAGDGPDADRLEKLAHTVGVADDVIFTGTLTRDVLIPYLRLADVFALNTSFESFSFQTIEAMQTETPVVVARSGNLPEFITHEENGLLVRHDAKNELVEAITRVLHQDRLKDRLTRRGLKTAKAFQERETIAEITQLINTHATHRKRN